MPATEKDASKDKKDAEKKNDKKSDPKDLLAQDELVSSLF